MVRNNLLLSKNTTTLFGLMFVFHIEVFFLVLLVVFVLYLYLYLLRTGKWWRTIYGWQRRQGLSEEQNRQLQPLTLDQTAKQQK